jgi:hypothetical protein
MEHCLYDIDHFTGSFIVRPAYSSITDFLWKHLGRLPASGPLRGTAGRKAYRIFIDALRGRPFLVRRRCHLKDKK